MSWTGQWMSEWVRDVCMSHQSDWSYYKQPIKLPLVKVNHVCGDFILILERPSLFFYKQKHVFIWHIRCFRLLWLSPGLVDGFQKTSEFNNQPKNHSLWNTLTCHQGFAPGHFEWNESQPLGNLVNSRTGAIVFSARCTIGMVRGLCPWWSPGSRRYHLHYVQFTKKEFSPDRLRLRNMFQFVSASFNLVALFSWLFTE